MSKRPQRKMRTGTVSNCNMDKTVVVRVDRRVQHPLYHKYLTRSKKFLAHDEANACQEGDRVRIVETRPLSARKRWRVVEIIEKTK